MGTQVILLILSCSGTTVYVFVNVIVTAINYLLRPVKIHMYSVYFMKKVKH